MNEEGFEGTDLATLAHLECLWMPMVSGANQNEERVRRTRSSFCVAEREGFASENLFERIVRAKRDKSPRPGREKALCLLTKN